MKLKEVPRNLYLFVVKCMKNLASLVHQKLTRKDFAISYKFLMKLYVFI